MTNDRHDPPDLWLVDLMAATESLLEIGAPFEFGPSGNPIGLVDGGARSGQAGQSVAQSKAVARLALRCLLAGYVGLEAARRPFVLTSTGKPSLGDTTVIDRKTHGQRAGRLEFSLAHIDATALIGISQVGPIGVDLEGPRQIRISAARRAHLEAAAAPLDSTRALVDGPPDQRFLQAWVRLEALAKATGEGVGGLLGRLDDATRPLIGTMAEGQPIRVRDVVLPMGTDLFAAVGGVERQFGAGWGPPVARVLPLDRAVLAGLIAGRLPDVAADV